MIDEKQIDDWPSLDGFKSISKEHDGLGVIGEKPKTAAKKAVSQSGFENAELVEKNFI